MKIEILGSGGAVTTPRPLCFCPLCRKARKLGPPHQRTGPSLFVHGPDLLVDTPEESAFQLARSGVRRVAAGLYSHWHPDHVMGLRVWEMNRDFRRWPREERPTPVYFPGRVRDDLVERLGAGSHLEFLESQGLIRSIVVEEGASVELTGCTLRPFPLAEEYVYAFLLEEADGARVLLAPDELVGWIPPDWLGPLDLAVLPMGVVEFDPFTGVRRIPADHPILAAEATFRQTLEIVESLDVRRVVLTHIEEPDGLDHDDLVRLEAELEARGHADVRFAYDTMVIEV